MYKILESKIANLVKQNFNKMEVKDICSLRGFDGRAHFLNYINFLQKKNSI